MNNVFSKQFKRATFPLTLALSPSEGKGCAVIPGRRRASAIILGTFCLTLVASFCVKAAEKVTVWGESDSKLIPVNVSGFTGESATALKFDLEVAGFSMVSPEQAIFLINGSSEGQLKGFVTDRNKNSLLAKAYSGGTPRVQAHAFADDIVALFGRKGIARTRIAFKVDTGENSEIYVADYDGHNAVPVTRDATVVAAPAWGAGNRLLLYTSYKLGNPYIFSHDLTTGARSAVARYGGLNTSAAVSQDGTKVTMILSKGGRPDVYVAGIDGANLKQITQTKAGASSPCWSPDGRMICFSSTDGGSSALYVVPAGGGAMQRVRTVGVANATEPDWSPDGKTIVFTRQVGSGFEICTVPASGGEATVLVPGEDPSWAPNSRTVIYAKRRGNGQRGLSLLDVPTKQAKDIAKVLGSNSQPSWAK
jgi:TolB protein